MSYWDGNNLLNARNNEVEGENSMYYTILYYTLLQKTNVSNQVDFEMYCRINSAIFCTALIGYPGLYRRHPSNWEDTSHDEITAKICFFNLNKNNERIQEVWKQVLRQRFNYDVLNPDKPNKILHPRDIIYYGCLAGSFWSKLLSPLLLIDLCFSLLKNKEESSGKMLWFLRIDTLNDGLVKSFLQSIFNSMLKFKYGDNAMKKVLNIFFNNDQEHPIITLANLIWK